MRRIAIIDHSSHELMVEDINEEVLESMYDGDEQKYIDDTYEFEGDYSWDWIEDTQYFQEDDKTPMEVEFTDLL